MWKLEAFSAQTLDFTETQETSGEFYKMKYTLAYSDYHFNEGEGIEAILGFSGKTISDKL